MVSILFYLNATPPPPSPSPSRPSRRAVPVAALVGLLATIGTAIPLYLWWRQIRGPVARKRGEKRVTL